MKRFLLLLALILSPLAGGAQSLFPNPAGGDSIAPAASPVPGTAATTGSAANGPGAHDAAATVPLPGQTGGPQLDKVPQPRPDSFSSGGGGGGHSHKARAASTAPATFQIEQELMVRVRLRRAETRVLNDPAVQDEWAAAHRTRTDPERRAALTAYYNHFYGKVLKLEPKLAQQVGNRKQAALDRMKYTRLGSDPTADSLFARQSAPDPTLEAPDNSQ